MDTDKKWGEQQTQDQKHSDNRLNWISWFPKNFQNNDGDAGGLSRLQDNHT